MKNKAVKIVWRDIAGITSADNSSAWMDEDQLIKEGKELFNHEYTSYGMIIYENKDFIVYAGTTDNDGLYSDCGMIPKSVIIKIDKLDEKRAKGR